MFAWSVIRTPRIGTTADTPSSQEDALGDDMGDQHSMADRVIELAAQRRAAKFAGSIPVSMPDEQHIPRQCSPGPSRYDLFHTPLGEGKV